MLARQMLKNGFDYVLRAATTVCMGRIAVRAPLEARGRDSVSLRVMCVQDGNTTTVQRKHIVHGTRQLRHGVRLHGGSRRTSAALAERLQERERQPELEARELEDLRRTRKAHAPTEQHDNHVQHDQHGERDADVEKDPRCPAKGAHARQTL